MLPARAIRFSETGQAYVYVIGDDERVSIMNVETGMDDGQSIEILAGARPGDRVVDAHLQRFVDGQPVSILSP
jgi:multidrug efflux pump subunit AcrA (membrane-fusion protein)